MAVVYKAFDKEIEEKVALKLLRPEIVAEEKTIKRFRNELKYARRITHKNVCRMYDLNKEERTYFIIMEYVPGEDLKSSIKRMGPLSSGKAIFIAKQVCEGLAEAHRLGVIHRDLKPANVLVDRAGEPHVTDFGLAKRVEGGSDLHGQPLPGELEGALLRDHGAPGVGEVEVGRVGSDAPEQRLAQQQSQVGAPGKERLHALGRIGRGDVPAGGDEGPSGPGERLRDVEAEQRPPVASREARDDLREKRPAGGGLLPARGGDGRGGRYGGRHVSARR